MVETLCLRVNRQEATGSILKASKRVIEVCTKITLNFLTRKTIIGHVGRGCIARHICAIGQVVVVGQHCTVLIGHRAYTTQMVADVVVGSPSVGRVTHGSSTGNCNTLRGKCAILYIPSQRTSIDETVSVCALSLILCAVGQIGIIDERRIVATQLRWQVTKIIRNILIF